MTRRDWLALAAAAPLPAANTPDIDRFFDDFLAQWVRADPEMATALRFFTGEETGLRKFDRAKLTSEQRISADIFEYQLSDIVAEEPYLRYSFPLNQFRGVQVRLPSLMTDLHPVRNRKERGELPRPAAGGRPVDRPHAGHDAGPRAAGNPAAGIHRRFTTPEPGQNILVTSFAERLRKAVLENAMAARAAKIVGE
jgi:hypothetical protein